MRIRAAHLLLAALTPSALVAQAGTWIQSPVNGHYYALTPPGDWESTRAWAQANQAELVTIRNAAEQQWLVQTFVTPQQATRWIGFNDLAQQGQWVWSSGEPVTFTNWGGGEPNFPGVERRTEMQPGGVWNNQSNWSRQGIAERRPPGSFQPFGQGCADPGFGAPALSAPAGSTPGIGRSCTLAVGNLPPSVTVAVMVYGFSTTTNLGPGGWYPLPFDLGVLGWIGCSQLVSTDSTDLAITTTGSATLAISLPNLPQIVGLVFHGQAVVLYHPTGVAVTAGITGTIGY